AGKGNGLPSGPRYMLNVIAFNNCPAGDFIGSNRHMIAVQADFDDGLLGGKNSKPDPFLRNNDILLSLGDTFRVIDGNACDAEGARFQLPANPYNCPDPTQDVNADGSIIDECLGEDLTFHAYEVYVRLVGKPGTGIDVRTCGEAIDPDTLEEVIICSTENVVEVRMTGKGKMQFKDKISELTTVLADVDFDGDLDRVGLFDPALENYFWNWNTSGKAHAQLVFIPIPD
ncbi:MAG: hypothetical protein L0958_06190, partial [Candidatus Mariimomonas ferrooxydans]